MRYDELDAVLEYVATVCGDLDLRWALLGGVASNLYRDRPRLTDDVDVTLAVDRSRWPSLAARLAGDGWSLQPRGEYPDVVLARAPSRLAIDILIAKTPYQHEALARARRDTAIGGIVVPVLACEDVIIHKLLAARHVDLDDIERILATRPPLDEDYLDRWIDAWQLRPLWERIRAACADPARG